MASTTRSLRVNVAVLIKYKKYGQQGQCTSLTLKCEYKMLGHSSNFLNIMCHVK